MPRQPAPSGSWTTATPTARRPRCAATASACSRATSRTWAGRRSTAAPLAIGTRAGVKTLTRSDARASRSTSARGASTRRDVLVRARGLGAARPGLGIDVGNPHVVVALPDTDELEGLDLDGAAAAAPRAAARRERRVRRAERPARARGRRARSACACSSAASARRSAAARASPRRPSRCGTGRARRLPTTGRVEVPGGTLGVRMPRGRRRACTSCCPARRRWSTRARSRSPEPRGSASAAATMRLARRRAVPPHLEHAEPAAGRGAVHAVARRRTSPRAIAAASPSRDCAARRARRPIARRAGGSSARAGRAARSCRRGSADWSGCVRNDDVVGNIVGQRRR